jgi:hypothetical protein
MLAITRFANNSEQMLLFFQKLERLAYGLFILPFSANDRKKKYNPLKRSLRDRKGDRNPFIDVELPDHEKETILSIIEHGLHKSRPAAARLLLLRLDMLQTGKPISYYNQLTEQEPFSVEHLLPLSPEADSQWLRDFPDETLRIFNTGLFGNLFLVRQDSENPLMGNYDFTEKHAILFKENRDHPIHSTNELKHQKEWKLNDIAKRQSTLLDGINKIWPS